MKLFLAPMEGVVDSIMRETLTSLGGIDQCVSEFLRVTDQVYPEKVFYRNCPELQNEGRTVSGVPVFVQLLGGHPEPLAANALLASRLGAPGIDLNFGCPAKTVNRHDGGATLLNYPNRIFNIVKAVRTAVPESIPVTAKIRLGFNDPSQCVEVAHAVNEARADWLTVHCRTKIDGYRPPVYWEWIPRIREKVKIKIIANGDIRNRSDLALCKEITGCSEFMLGRGVISNPFLFAEIVGLTPQVSQNLTVLRQFFLSCMTRESGAFAIARTKQWLKFMKVYNPKYEQLFNAIKILHAPDEVLELLSLDDEQ